MERSPTIVCVKCLQESQGIKWARVSVLAPRAKKPNVWRPRIQDRKIVCNNVMDYFDRRLGPLWWGVVERELYAKNLDAGERVIWKRWLEEKNEKEGRRSRLRAPCCGKSTFRYKMMQNETGAWFCRRCIDAPPNGNYAQTQTGNDGNNTPDTSSCGYEQTEILPPWRVQPPAKRQETMSPEDLNAALLCTQQLC